MEENLEKPIGEQSEYLECRSSEANARTRRLAKSVSLHSRARTLSNHRPLPLNRVHPWRGISMPCHRLQHQIGWPVRCASLHAPYALAQVGSAKRNPTIVGLVGLRSER
jgi:hypothetical protein